MAVYKDVIVDIPPHSYAQKKGDVIYNYTYTDYFRNEDRNPRNKSKSTGVRIETMDGKMHPNDNYYSLLKIPRLRKESEIVNIGYTAVVEAGFSQLSLLTILSSILGERRAKQIRSVCSYMVKEGCAMSYIDFFTRDEYFLKEDEILSSQRVDEIFEELTHDEMIDFYNEWIPKINSGNCICYDITSVSTYSKMTKEAEYGYHPDHDKLPQMNIGLFASEDDQYPLYMFSYNGSSNDVSNIVEACANARTAGIDGKFKIVMDGGFFDDKKLNTLHSENLYITVGMPAYLDVSKRYIDQYGAGLFSPEFYLSHNGTYGRIIKNQEIFGIPGSVFIGLCTESSSLLNEDLDAKLLRYEQEIPEIVEYDTIIKKEKYTGLFDFKRSPDGSGFSFSRNESKIKEVRKRFGYFAIFTTDETATAQRIIDWYREKDYDEKMFYDLKQYMGEKRPGVHYQGAFHGKYAILMIALIFRTWLKKHLQSYEIAHHLSLKRCIMKLSDIKMLIDDDEIRLLKSITAEQRELLRLCEVDPETLEDCVRNGLLEKKYNHMN